MRSDKYLRMMAAYDGHKGPVTITAIKAGIPEALIGRLTGRQLGAVMSAINAAYHRGRAAAGAEVIDDCVYIRGRLIPLAAVDSIRITDSQERRLMDAHGVQCAVSYCDQDGNPVDTATARAVNGKGYYYTETWTTRRYCLDYTETH